MKNKYKIILIICVIIGICSILVGSIAYYRIVVEGNIKGSTGNAVFVLKDENSNVWNNKEINLGKVNPGDSGEFTVTMDASGSTVDMYATLEIDRGTLPTNLKFYITSDHKSELHKYYSFLETTNQTETLTIYWYWNPYISDEEDSKFINIDSIEANIRVSAVQISEYAMMKNGYRYDNGGTEFWNKTYKPYIRTITFGNDLSNLPSECTKENLCWDITYDSTPAPTNFSNEKNSVKMLSNLKNIALTNYSEKVYAYLIDSGLSIVDSTENVNKQPLYNLYIVSGAPIFAPPNSSNLFSDFISLISISFNNNFNTSKAIYMNSMFDTCDLLMSLDLDDFNTSNVTDMGYMFKDCSSLTSLDLSNFNTSNVNGMSNMFNGCKSLKSLDLSNFDISNVTSMFVMFASCSSLTNLDLSSFNTLNVTDMCQMFYNCLSLTSLDLSSFNTSNVTNMSGMFRGCSSLVSLDLSNFNSSNIIDMSSMFNACSSLTSLDLSSFNTSNVTNMMFMFSNCESLTSLNLSSFNVSNVTNMTATFQNCSRLQTEISIVNINTTTYNHMLYSAATDPSAHIIIGYTTDTETIATAMRDTCTNNAAKARIELKKID